MEHFERHVRELEAFGHRGSTTANEHRAAEYLAGELRSIGIEPVMEQFHGSRSMAERLLVHVIVAAAGAALLWRAPVATVALGAAALISLLVEHSTRSVWLSWPVCRRKSLNVCGRVAPSVEPKRRVILCAHYDTQPAAWVWAINRVTSRLSFRAPLLLKTPMLPMIALMAGQIALGGLALALGAGAALSVLGGILLAAYAVFGVLLVQWALGRPVPGAADNASGSAAVLDIAAAWRDNAPASDVELLVLLSGCEECGLLGAAAWADAHRQEIRSLPTVFLNIDGIGLGPPRLLGIEVPVAGLPLRADPAVLQVALDVARDMGLSDVGPYTLPTTDGVAFLARGIRGATIVGFQAGGVLPNYHTPRDTANNMDWPSARQGLEFANRVCRRLATEPL